MPELGGIRATAFSFEVAPASRHLTDQPEHGHTVVSRGGKGIPDSQPCPGTFLPINLKGQSQIPFSPWTSALDSSPVHLFMTGLIAAAGHQPPAGTESRASQPQGGGCGPQRATTTR